MIQLSDIRQHRHHVSRQERKILSFDKIHYIVSSKKLFKYREFVQEYYDPISVRESSL